MKECPTLRRLLDNELRLLRESQDLEQNDPLVGEWEEALANVRRLYQGYLEEPEWLRVRVNPKTKP